MENIEGYVAGMLDSDLISNLVDQLHWMIANSKFPEEDKTRAIVYAGIQKTSVLSNGLMHGVNPLRVERLGDAIGLIFKISRNDKLFKNLVADHPLFGTYVKTFVDLRFAYFSLSYERTANCEVVGAATGMYPYRAREPDAINRAEVATPENAWVAGLWRVTNNVAITVEMLLPYSGD